MERQTTQQSEDIRREELLSTHPFNVKDKVNLELSFYKDVTFLGTVYGKYGKQEQGDVTIVFLKDENKNIYTCSEEFYHQIFNMISEKYEDSKNKEEFEKWQISGKAFRNKEFSITIAAKIVDNVEYKGVKQTKLGYIKVKSCGNF